MDILYILCK